MFRSLLSANSRLPMWCLSLCSTARTAPIDGQGPVKVERDESGVPFYAQGRHPGR